MKKELKKWIAALLCLALGLSLCACERLEALKDLELPPPPGSAESQAPETPAPARTPEPTGSPEPAQTPAPTDAPEPGGEPEPESVALERRVLVNIQRTELEEMDPENGTAPILNFTYETPRVSIDGGEEAASVINEVLSILEENFYTGEDYGLGDILKLAGQANGPLGYTMMLELAQDNYSYVRSVGESEELPYTFSAGMQVGVARADEAMVSLVYHLAEYTGGDHGDSGSRGFVFDTESGKRLRLEDLSADGEDFIEFLAAYMLDLAESREGTYGSIDLETAKAMLGAEDLAGVCRALLRDGSWFFDEEGLLIFSDAYEIAPGAAGQVEFRIPYGQLEGVLLEKYLPVTGRGAGRLSLLPVDQAEEGTEEIVDRIEADSGGEELLLRIEGTVTDFKISTTHYADAFFETAQLWYASHLTDCAVQLSARLPEGMPELIISYVSGGRNISLYLTEDEDGGFALIDGDIQAVG